MVKSNSTVLTNHIAGGIMSESIIGGIDFSGRRVERIMLQNEIIGLLTLKTPVESGATVTFEELRQFILGAKILENLSAGDQYLEVCAALTQMQKEDGSIKITGNFGADDCVIQINYDFFPKTSH